MAAVTATPKSPELAGRSPWQTSTRAAMGPRWISEGMAAGGPQAGGSRAGGEGGGCGRQAAGVPVPGEQDRKPCPIRSEVAGEECQGASRHPNSMTTAAPQHRRLINAATFSGCLPSASNNEPVPQHMMQKSNTLPSYNTAGSGGGRPAVAEVHMQGTAVAGAAQAPRQAEGFNPVAFATGIKALEGTPLGKLLNATPDIVVDGIPRRIVRTVAANEGGGIHAYAAKHRVGSSGLPPPFSQHQAAVGQLGGTPVTANGPSWQPNHPLDAAPWPGQSQVHQPQVLEGWHSTTPLMAQESRVEGRAKTAKAGSGGSTRNDWKKQQAPAGQFQTCRAHSASPLSPGPCTCTALASEPERKGNAQAVPLHPGDGSDGGGQSPGLRLHPPGYWHPEAAKLLHNTIAGGKAALQLAPQVPLLVESPAFDGDSGGARGSPNSALDLRLPGEGGLQHPPLLVESPPNGHGGTGMDLRLDEDMQLEQRVFEFFPCGPERCQGQEQGKAAEAAIPTAGVANIWPVQFAGAPQMPWHNQHHHQQQQQHHHQHHQQQQHHHHQQQQQQLMCKESLDATAGTPAVLLCRVRRLMFGEGSGMSWMPEGQGGHQGEEPTGGGVHLTADIPEDHGEGAVDLDLGLNLMARSMSVSSTSSTTCPVARKLSQKLVDHSMLAGLLRTEGGPTPMEECLEDQRQVMPVPISRALPGSTIMFHAISEVRQLEEGDVQPLVLSDLQHLLWECLNWPEVAVFSRKDGTVAWVNHAYAEVVASLYQTSWMEAALGQPMAVSGTAIVPSSYPVLMTASLQILASDGSEGGQPQCLVLHARGRRVETITRTLLGYLWTASRP